MIHIGFLGTPALAGSVLTTFIHHPNFSVDFVVTNPDKPVGRSQILTPSPVKIIAESGNIPVFTPQKIRWNIEFLSSLQAFPIDYLIVVAYGKILPIEILSLPKKRAINVHGSLLPKYRWASPIQESLLQGDIITGVTIMEMSEWMDEGDSIFTKEIPISNQETTESLFEKFMNVSWEALIHAIQWLENNTILPIPQDHTKATYCTKILKEHGLINWDMPAKKLYNLWQAYTPWPGIYTFYEWKRLLIEQCEYTNENIDNQTIGTVIKRNDNSIEVICWTGRLKLYSVKLEGKTTQDIHTFLLGKPHFIWSLL